MQPKISSADMLQVYGSVPDALRKLASENDELRQKLAAVQRRDDAIKLAHMMHNKGIDSDVPVEQLTERLEKIAEQDEQQFKNYQDAVELVGPDMGTKIAQLDNSEERSGIGGSDLERMLMGQIG